MNPGADPRLATVLSGVIRIVDDINGNEALARILQDGNGGILFRSIREVTRAAGVLENGLSIPVFVMTGSTGVGKTAILNAMLQKDSQGLSWRRPTTVTPLLHHHVSQPGPELTGILRECAYASHSMDCLSEALIVDLPDKSCIDPAAGERVSALLRQADVVIIVNSPERCGDQSSWELIQEFSDTGAFVFVMNKCDLIYASAGMSPASNWKADLAQLGFANPTFNQLSVHWTDKLGANPAGYEAFQKFRDWVSRGIQGKALESIRRRRLARALNDMAAKIESLLLADVRPRWFQVEKEWESEIQAEAGHLSETVMEGLDRRSDEMEGFLEADLRDRLRGIMALWLRLFGRGRSGGGGLLTGGWRSLLGQLALGSREPTNRREQASRLALEPAIDGSGADRRRLDLMDRLAGRVIGHGLPVDSVRASFRTLSEAPWRDPLLAQARTVLDEFEGKRLASGGLNGLIRDMSIGLANYLPPLGLLGILSWPVILFFDPLGWKRTPQWFDLFLPVLGLVLLLIGLQALLGIVMPFQWPAIRAELRQRLKLAKAVEMEREYLGILAKCMAKMEEHGRLLLELVGRARDLGRAAGPSPDEINATESFFARPVPEMRQ